METDYESLQEYIISDKGDDVVNSRFSYENEKATATIEEVKLSEVGSENGPVRTQVTIF